MDDADRVRRALHSMSLDRWMRVDLVVIASLRSECKEEVRCLFGLVAKEVNRVKGFVGEMLQTVGLVPSLWKYVDADLSSYHMHTHTRISW